MDLRIDGNPTPRSNHRPLSNRFTPRPNSRVNDINPITGLKIQTPRGNRGDTDKCARLPSRESTKPDSVPFLDLQFLGKEPDLSYVGPEISERNPPHTASTVSWGTPRSASHRFSEKVVLEQVPKKTAKTTKIPKETDGHQDIVPLDLAPPSARYKALYQKYEDEMKQAYQNHIVKQPTENISSNSVIPSTKPVPHPSTDYSPQPYTHLSNDVTQLPSTSITNDAQKKLDAEAVIDFRRKEKLIETVMIDQLSRAVISAPEQDDRDTLHTPGLSRGANRQLHSSKVSTRTSATENLLMKRVRFGARILSRHSVDSVKELTGFYFHVDQSLTIYEYRQFGKSAKALPFIGRGRYGFLRGPRATQTYALTDIYAGADLEFGTSDHPTLPKRMKDEDSVVFRVTDVDDGEKRAILLSSVRPADREKEYIKLHMPDSTEEMENRITLLNVQKYTRDQLKTRGIKTVLGMWHECGTLDTQNCGRLSRYDLEKLALAYRIDPPYGLLESLLEQLDDGSGYLDYSPFLRSLLGEMNERRKSFVRRAFLKVDHSRCGTVSFSDVRKFFCAKSHLSVRSGESTEEQIFQTFLDYFRTNTESYRSSRQNEEITYTAFEAYYEGVSIGVEDYDDFVAILRNTWGV